MAFQKLRLPGFVLGTLLLANLAWGLEFGLGESKEALKLKYDVQTTDHGTGRVTFNLTIEDAGRLKPLNSVELMITPQGETGVVDLAVPLAMREVDGKIAIRVHLKRELAERAEIWLKTRNLDGNLRALEGHYFSIPLAAELKKIAPKPN